MFDWLYRKMAEGIIHNLDLSSIILEATKSEDVQKQILAMTDQLYERYKAKTLGAIGGTLKGTITEESNMNQLSGLPIPAKYKKLLTNPFVQMIIGGIGQNKGESASGLP